MQSSTAQRLFRLFWRPVPVRTTNWASVSTVAHCCPDGKLPNSDHIYSIMRVVSIPDYSLGPGLWPGGCAVLCCAVLCCVLHAWVANLMEVEGDDAMMLEAYSNPSAWFIVFVRPPVPCPLILILIS